MVKPVGFPVKDWVAAQAPEGAVLEGQYARLEPLEAEAHVGDLYRANIEDTSEGNWDYLPYGPFHAQATYHRWVREMSAQDDPFFYAIKNKDVGRFCGVASYLRITPDVGTIEVGHINMAPALQRTRAATEAMYLMMKWAFEAGYRRYEWKCDALNAGSRAGAQRFGFSYEGVFRQATLY